MACAEIVSLHLISYPYGCRRVRSAEGDVQSALPGFPTPGRTHVGVFHMVGVVQVLLQVPRADNLTPLGDEEESLRHYYGQALVAKGVAVCQVLDCHRFAEPIKVEEVRRVSQKGRREVSTSSITTSIAYQLCIPDRARGFPTGPSEDWPSGVFFCCFVCHCLPVLRFGA